MPYNPVFFVGFAHDEVAEERKLTGELVLQAHEDRAVHVAFAGGDYAVVGEMSDGRARGYAVEVGIYNFRPAAEGKGIHAELLSHAANRRVEGRRLFEVAFRGFRAGRVGLDNFKGFVEVFLGDGLGIIHDFEHHDVFEFRSELGAEHHFVAAGSVEAGNATADEAYAHLADGVHGADDAHCLVKVLQSFFVADIAVYMEVRNVEAIEEVGIHIRRAEGIRLKASARGVWFFYRPQHDRHFEALCKKRHDCAERECREKGDKHIGAVFFKTFENFERLLFGLDHVFAADYLDVGNFAEHFNGVAALLLHCLVRPIYFCQR